MPEFKKGDRAVYTGKGVNCCFEERIGVGLVVKGDPEEGFVKVRMDNMDHDINVSVKNIELIEEDKMDTVTLKKEDLQKAYAEGCSDVKRVLDKLYPGQTHAVDSWKEFKTVIPAEWDIQFRFAPFEGEWGMANRDGEKFAPIGGYDFKVDGGRLFWRKGNRG